MSACGAAEPTHSDREAKCVASFCVCTNNLCINASTTLHISRMTRPNIRPAIRNVHELNSRCETCVASRHSVPFANKYGIGIHNVSRLYQIVLVLIILRRRTQMNYIDRAIRGGHFFATDFHGPFGSSGELKLMLQFWHFHDIFDCLIVNIIEI